MFIAKFEIVTKSKTYAPGSKLPDDIVAALPADSYLDKTAEAKAEAALKAEAKAKAEAEEKLKQK